jgi:hypothetical protein
MEVKEEQIMVYSERMCMKPEEQGQSKGSLPKIKIIYTVCPEVSFPAVKCPESEGYH